MSIDHLVWEEHAWRNRLQSLLLLFVMGAFLAALGWLLWGEQGLWMLLGMGLVAVGFSPSFSPALVMRLYGARPIPAGQLPELHASLRQLAERAGLQHAPALYLVPSSMLNAFAVGTPENSSVAVSDGLLRQLNLRELQGVLAHEVSHIRNRDLWVMGLADLFSRATTVLSWLGQLLVLINLPLILMGGVLISWPAVFLLVFAPSLSALAQLALSRTREFDADLNGARLTGDPDGLASALLKIERVQGNWLERVFLPGRRVPEPSLLRTHPDTSERVARLMALKSRLGERGDAYHDRDPVRLQVYGEPVRRPPGWHISGLWH